MREPPKYIKDKSGNEIINPKWEEWRRLNPETLMKDKPFSGMFDFKGLWESGKESRVRADQREREKEFDERKQSSPYWQSRTQAQQKIAQEKGISPEKMEKILKIDPNFDFSTVQEDPPLSPEQQKEAGAAGSSDLAAINQMLIAKLAEERGLSLDEAELILGKQDIARAKASGGTALSSAREIQVGQEQEALAGQLGQYGQLGVQAQELDYSEATRVALIDGLPRAIQFGIGGAVVGGGAGSLAAPGIGTIVGAAAGFVSSFVGSIISDLKEQRRDMNEKPKITLQDGKSNLNDIIGMMRDAPSYNHKQQLVAQFNEQLALIDQAYRQVKLDTSRDVLLFERSEDILADFEWYYSANGERDNLVQEMYIALNTQTDPENIYTTLEMLHRRGLLKENS